MQISLEADAFSDGQIQSKLWLLKNLEDQLKGSAPLNVWLLAGWYGLIGFLALSRDRLNINAIRSFDLDADAVSIADTINESWVYQQWKFKAFVADVNTIKYTNSKTWGAKPQLVINTSTEHIESSDWFERIPKGTWVALQSTDQIHSQHVSTVASIEEFESRFSMTKQTFRGSLEFSYPNTTISKIYDYWSKIIIVSKESLSVRNVSPP